MAFEQRDNTGVLWKNDKKTSDNHPSAKGSALIDGVEYWVDCWVKDGAKGKFQSLSFKRKDEARTAQRSQPRDDFDDAF